MFLENDKNQRIFNDSNYHDDTSLRIGFEYT